MVSGLIEILIVRVNQGELFPGETHSLMSFGTQKDVRFVRDDPWFGQKLKP